MKRVLDWLERHPNLTLIAFGLLPVAFCFIIDLWHWFWSTPPWTNPFWPDLGPHYDYRWGICDF